MYIIGSVHCFLISFRFVMIVLRIYVNDNKVSTHAHCIYHVQQKVHGIKIIVR